MGDFDDLILNDGSKPLDPSKNDYFLVTITDLLPGKTYPIEFRWNYATKEKNPNWSSVVKVTTPGYAPLAVTNIIPTWDGTDFVLTFTSNPASAGNENLSYYKITLNGGGGTVIKELTPSSGSTQIFRIPINKNSTPFNITVNAISGSIIAVDVNGNQSPTTTFPLTTRTSTLPTPVITVSSILNGYSVSYTTPTDKQFDHIEIEEVESNASTDPASGYSTIFYGVANPAVIIVPNTNKRWIRARFFDNGGLGTSYSTAVSVTPTNPVTVDNIAPSAPASGSVSAGVDNSTGATIGFNAYLSISWSAVSDSTLRGYRIRFRENGTSNPYSYVDSPGTGTTFRLNGLSIGTTYEVAIASYDEYNNTSSSYTSLGTAIASGTPFIGKNVTTTGYFGASATGDTGTFKFGYGVQDSGGTKRGLNFNSSNYWYIDSAQSALFKLGGDANNYIEWNGSTFVVQGDIRAKAGNFSGNVQIQSGGSLYSGTIVSGNLSGAGFILNNSGLTFNSSTVNGITTINGSTGLLTTSSANIGGWNVTSSAISKSTSSGTLTLNSNNSQITAASSSYSAGVSVPENNLVSDIVFWAGSAGRSISSKYYVTADGVLNASGAVIQGSLDASQITGGTITGATILTSTSYPRIRLQDGAGSRDRIVFEPVQGTLYNINSTDGLLSIIGPSSILLYPSYISVDKEIWYGSTAVSMGVSRVRGIDTIVSTSGNVPTQNLTVANSTLNPSGSIMLVYQN